MLIAQRQIGPSFPPYVIAEIGVNHDGSLGRALSLVERAAEAGADAVKFQLFRAELLMSRASVLAAYQAAAGETDPVEMLRRLELSTGDMGTLLGHARRLGVHAIVSVFSVELVAEAERQGWDAFKTASPDIIHRPLLESLAETGRPLILSTGAATMEEVMGAIAWLRGGGRAPINLALLQCVSSYPAPEGQAALGGIGALERATGLPVGYSDHTGAVDTGALAVAAGACILEKHFTDDRSAKGPDHAASLEPAGLAEYIRLARRAHAMVGLREKSPLAVEADVRRVSRQSIVSSRLIRAGETITRGAVTFKRPGTGISPGRLDELTGKRVLRDIAPDTPLKPEDFE